MKVKRNKKDQWGSKSNFKDRNTEAGGHWL